VLLVGPGLLRLVGLWAGLLSLCLLRLLCPRPLVPSLCPRLCLLLLALRLLVLQPAQQQP
jgi:hypothetical protein